MYPTPITKYQIIDAEAEEFNTPDKLEYKFGPVAAGSLEFEYRGPHNCHVCLSPGPGEMDPMYEFILGGWENTQSVIRHCRQKPDKVAYKIKCRNQILIVNRSQNVRHCNGP